MYELSRVRLHSIGPPGARYQDVLLDFSGVGELLNAPSQESMFSAGVHVDTTAGGAPRRPSPASVLFLENGGGKSVLIKLIFSVMLPGRRQVVGTTNTRVLEKFVGAKDVAHVALEWQHTKTGQRLITGKVSEWRGHVVSADPANLIDAWYCFRPSVALQLDTLPLTADGRVLTMSGFKECLDTQHHDAAELNLFWTRKHHEWTEQLGQVGLDTELFRYQRAMNAGEGEAADAFAFGTDDAFVEFLLRAVLDESAPGDLAEVVRNYAETLGQRGELMAERDFVAGALDRLAPLVDEESMAEASRTLARTARNEAREFAAEILARDAVEAERITGLATQVDEMRGEERLAEGDHRRKLAVVTELRRVVAGLRLDAAQADCDRIAEQVAEARLTARAWRATSTVLGHASAARKASATRKLVNSREASARPALAAKDAAAQALARGLLALADTAATEATDAARTAAAARAAAEKAQQQRDTATRTAAEHSARAEQLSARIDEVRAEISRATKAGRLADGVDVRSAATAAHDDANRAAAQLRDAERELHDLERAVSDAQLAVHRAQQEQASLAATAEAASAELTTARRRGDALATHPRLAGLLGVDKINLETDLPALLTKLAEARAETERAQTELWIAAAADDRALTALGTGGLLPAPDDVQAALDVLERAGITAWSGFRYLSTLDEGRRAAALERLPHLVGGVLINDPGKLDRARTVLTDANLVPDAVLAVGTTETVAAAATGTAAVAEFVVLPNPALYDEDAADRTREEITKRQTQRRSRLGEYAAALGVDSELEWKLTAWREDYPAGTLGVLAEQAESTRIAAESAATQVTSAQHRFSELDERRTALRESLPELREHARAAADSARDLAELVHAAARVPQWQDAAAAAREIVDRASEEAQQAQLVAARHREEAAEAQREADGHHRTAASARAELATVPGGGSVAAADPVPAEPIEVLRATFADAAQAYTKVEVGNDLRAELDHAEHAEATARAALEALDPQVRMLAGRLVEGSDGSDAAAREAAEQRADRKLQALEVERAEAIGSLATRRAEYEALPAAPSALDSMRRPGSVGYGMDLIAAAGEEAAAATRALADAQARRADAENALAAAEASATGFGVLAESLGHLLGADDQISGGQPYAGDVDAARQRASALSSALATADAAVVAAEKRVREHADALVSYAADKRFEQLSSPVRRQIVGVRRDNLPEHAHEWVAALRPRLRTLTGDLEQIDRHRSGIVTRLQGLVDGALRVLRSAQRLSRLPDGLGDWSGTEFLRIRFADPDESVVLDQLGAVVDEAAAERMNKGAKSTKADGMSLLLRAVRAAVPKGFRIDMLKPDSVLRTERQRVSEVKDVFSGGQQLTAAIILYCTMAALRANDKGRLADRHSGVLFLDNPIGRASAGYLLELQRAVASALGVQLVYTTGLFDAGALSEFPLIIRLRNDADLRAGRKYLSVDETIRSSLAELGDPDDVARMSATRVFQRTR